MQAPTETFRHDADPDMVDKMLSALVTDGEAAPPCRALSIDAQKQYLCKHIESLSIEDRKEIGGVLVRYKLAAQLRPCHEGIIINLDTLSAPVVGHMYDVMIAKQQRQAAGVSK